jgi:hypothetical protein
VALGGAVVDLHGTEAIGKEQSGKAVEVCCGSRGRVWHVAMNYGNAVVDWHSGVL